jgi:glycerol transport system ATP-binding protein
VANIELSHIAHTYEPSAPNPVYALKELNLTWRDGGTYSLLGPSGCGKSTMLNIISGLLIPSRGRVIFDGQDFTHKATPQRNIAQVFQMPVIYTLMTVGENLAFPLLCRGVEKAQCEKRVLEIAELLGLRERLKSPARRLAADEKQLVSLGRGLVRQDVTAVLMDEPLTVIDPQQKFEIRRKLKQINESLGLTMVFVTHDQNEAMSFADTVMVMDQGEVVQAGSPEELYERPRTTFVGYFIGSPAMNFLDCTLEGGRLHTGGGDIPLPPGVTPPSESAGLKLGIRPRYAGLSAKKGEWSLKVRLIKVHELGDHWVIRVAVGGAEFNLKTLPGVELPTDRAWVNLPPNKICLYQDGLLLGTDRAA